ncbi:interferon regulatory factor 8 isoform X2 [Protopterus annectens]|nr:interferon regulatory factor 8 isoform X2 [Protopterus annectens]
MNGSNCSDIADMDCSHMGIDELCPENGEECVLINRSPSPLPDNSRSQPSSDWWLQQANLVPAVRPECSGYGPYQTDFSRLVISFYYGGKLMGHVTTTRPEGCRISLSRPPVNNEAIYGPETLELIRFPSADMILNERQRHITNKLFGHLERGVLLYSNKQGIFIKRLCQGRVFWSSNCLAFKNGTNKLERDEVVKIFDTTQFLEELQTYRNNHCQFPDSVVTLCFGEEFPDNTPIRFKLIIVQIEQVGVRQYIETAARNYSSGNLELSDEGQQDHISRILHDLCAYGMPQRPFFRENHQITA